MSDNRPHQMRRDQADEGDDAGDGHSAAGAERHAGNGHDPHPRDIDTQALRGLFAKAEHTIRMTLAHQDGCADKDERQRQHHMAEAAVFQRAEQPESDLQGRERVGRQVHHQRGHRTGKARQRQSGQDQQQQSGIAPGDHQKREHREERRRGSGHRQDIGADIGETQRDHQHRAESRRLRRAEQDGEASGLRSRP